MITFKWNYSAPYLVQLVVTTNWTLAWHGDASIKVSDGGIRHIRSHFIYTETAKCVRNFALRFSCKISQNLIISRVIIIISRYKLINRIFITIISNYVTFHQDLMQCISCNLGKICSWDCLFEITAYTLRQMLRNLTQLEMKIIKIRLISLQYEIIMITQDIIEFWNILKNFAGESLCNTSNTFSNSSVGKLIALKYWWLRNFTRWLVALKKSFHNNTSVVDVTSATQHYKFHLRYWVHKSTFYCKVPSDLYFLLFVVA